jgi:hypothetical protein
VLVPLRPVIASQIAKIAHLPTFNIRGTQSEHSGKRTDKALQAPGEPTVFSASEEHLGILDGLVDAAAGAALDHAEQRAQVVTER